MIDRITSQFVGHDLPWLTSMTAHKSFEESLCSSTIPLGLQIHIHHFTVLVYGPPQVMLLAIDLYEGFIDVECIAIASVLTLQSSGV